MQDRVHGPDRQRLQSRVCGGSEVPISAVHSNQIGPTCISGQARGDQVACNKSKPSKADAISH